MGQDRSVLRRFEGRRVPAERSNVLRHSFGRSFRVCLYILPQKHAEQLAFLMWLKSALALPFTWVVERSEEHVPEWKVAVIELMNASFVVDTMAFGALNEVADPVRSLDVPVVEELGQRAEEHGIGSSLRTHTDHEVDDDTREYGVGKNLQRMLVE